MLLVNRITPGIIWAKIAVTNLFSGALVPLVFFPHWLEKIAMALPFKSIVYTPTVIYMEQQSPMHALGMVGMHLWVWAIVLWLLGKLMWNRAVRENYDSWRITYDSICTTEHFRRV